MIRNVVLWLLFVVCIGGAYVGVLKWQKDVQSGLTQWDATRARKHSLPIPVRTQNVSNESSNDVIGATCVTRPYSMAPIYVSMNTSALRCNRLERVNVQEGDVVKTGDTLFELDQSQFKMLLEREAANVKMLTAQVKTFESLLKDRAASAGELQVAEGELAEANLQHQLLQGDLENCVIKSPVDGVVGEVKLAQGTMVTASAELGVVYRLNPISVSVDFPIERLDSLKKGQSAEVKLDSFPNELFHGTVAGYAPNASTRTRVIAVNVNIENKDSRLRGGITGYCRILPSEGSVLTVPRVAVVRRKGKAVVFCVDKGVASLRPIETGAVVREGYLAVRSGLAEGEEVVIFGHEDLQEGDKVNPEWQEWSRRDREQFALSQPGA